MTVGTTSRVHGFISLPTVPLPKQTHQETTTSIILSNRKRMEEWNRKHENILKIYFMCPCSSIFIHIHPYLIWFKLAFQIAQPWVGPSQWLQAHPARKVAQWLVLSGLSKSVCFSSCGHARGAWFSRFQICVLGWFLLHWTVYSKMPPSVCYAFVSQAVNRWQGKSPTLSTKLIVSIQHF